MKPTSIEPVFAAVTPGVKQLPPDIRSAAATLGDMPFTEALDALRAEAAADIPAAVARLSGIDAAMAENSDDSRSTLNVHAAVKQVLAALHIETGDYETALTLAASALSLLALSPRRKDEPFMALLAAQLYDLAFIHSERKEFKQAERNIEKSLKLLGRLARLAPERYGAAHILALNAATSVSHNREQQAALLEQYQAATDTYLRMVNSGVEDATSRLVDSLATEGETLARMGRHREAVQYYVRALKFLTRIEPAMTRRQLELSIALGDAMLRLESMRDKAIHLLNTLLHKATRLNADEEHRRIVDILASSRTRDLDILALWHKIFPK